MRNLPVKRPIKPYTSYPQGRGSPTLPQSIIPQNNTKNRSIAGQVKTIIHMKNSKGEEVTLYQTQQVLNLADRDRGSWKVGNSVSQNRYHRRNRQ